MLVIACVALTGIAMHLIFRYGMHSEARAYQIPLWIVLAFGGIPLLYELLTKMVKLQFGSDLLAGISIVTAHCWVSIWRVLSLCSCSRAERLWRATPFVAPHRSSAR